MTAEEYRKYKKATKLVKYRGRKALAVIAAIPGKKWGTRTWKVSMIPYFITGTDKGRLNFRGGYQYWRNFTNALEAWEYFDSLDDWEDDG